MNQTWNTIRFRVLALAGDQIEIGKLTPSTSKERHLKLISSTYPRATTCHNHRHSTTSDRQMEDDQGKLPVWGEGREGAEEEVVLAEGRVRGRAQWQERRDRSWEVYGSKCLFWTYLGDFDGAWRPSPCCSWCVLWLFTCFLSFLFLSNHHHRHNPPPFAFHHQYHHQSTCSY